jgi:hypothetical protein
MAISAKRTIPGQREARRFLAAQNERGISSAKKHPGGVTSPPANLYKKNTAANLPLSDFQILPQFR